MYFRSGDVLEEFFKPHRSKTPASSLLSTQVWCEVSWPLAFLWSWTWANLMGLGDSWHPNTWRRTWPKNCAVKMEAPKYMWKKMLFRWERNCKWEFWQIVLWVPWQDVWIMICFEFFLGQKRMNMWHGTWATLGNLQVSKIMFQRHRLHFHVGIKILPADFWRVLEQL